MLSAETKLLLLINKITTFAQFFKEKERYSINRVQRT